MLTLIFIIQKCLRSDLSKHYRETSEGGLAKKYCRNKYYNKEMEEKIDRDN